jgi:hypothetical protein
MDEHEDRHDRVAGSLDPEPRRRLDPLEESLTALRRTYCRELVREGRLDWDGFDLGPEDFGSGCATVQLGDRRMPEFVKAERLRRWRPRRSRR